MLESPATPPHPLLATADILSARSLFDGLPYPVLLIGDDFEVLFSNTEAKRCYGEADRCFELAHGHDKPCTTDESLCPKLVAERTGRLTTARHVHDTCDGRVPFLICAVPLESGHVVTLELPTNHDPSEDIRRASWRALTVSTLALALLIPGVIFGPVGTLNGVFTLVLGCMALISAVEGVRATRRGLGPSHGRVLRSAAVGLSALAVGSGLFVLFMGVIVLARAIL